MKHYFQLALLCFFFFQACQTHQKPVINSNVLKETSENLVDEKSYHHFVIPAIYSYHKMDIDSNLLSNEWLEFEGKWEAKLYENKEGDIFTAINIETQTTSCIQYEAVLLKNKQNVFLEHFPQLDIYKFYSFEDKKLQQFEGDEQTVFAGYKFDFQEDSLAVQFMFCKENDFKSSIILNQYDGKLKKVSLTKIQ